MGRPFANLLFRSDRSFGASLLRLPDIAAKVKESGMESCAIADRGTLLGTVPLAGMIDGAKCIPACEIDHGGFPLILAAKDAEGYSNLCRILTRIGLDGDAALDRERCRGLAAIAGGFDSEIAQLALSSLDGREERAERMIAGLRESFDEVLIAVDHDGSPEADAICLFADRIAEKSGCRIVAGNDARHLPGDAEPFRMIARDSSIDPGFFDHSLRDADTLADNLARVFPESRIDTLFSDGIAFAASCGGELPAASLPAFDDPDAALAEAARKGLERMGLDSPEYRDRLESELAAIASGSYSSYILAAAAVSDLARDAGIPVGPGRGSAPGSLVNFALGITSVDPIRWNLSFERFFSQWRSVPPDIDIDVPSSRRKELAALIARRFGEGHAARCATVAVRRERGAARDAAMISGMDGAARAMLAERLDGLAFSEGVHASGIVVSGAPLDAIAPLKRHSDGTLACRMDGDSLSRLGLMKIDILSLDQLDAIERAAALIPGGIDPEAIPLDDPEAFAMYADRGSLAGIFQADGPGMREAAPEFAPKGIEELAALFAIYRPGPLKAGMLRRYERRKNGLEEPDWLGLPHLLKGILEPTRGLPIYQEQVMEMARAVAGLDAAEADSLRVAMKRRDPGALSGMREAFAAKSAARGVAEKDAMRVFGTMSEFAAYGFNRSHAVSYAILSCRTAWLKAHHPLEFARATIESRIAAGDRGGARAMLEAEIARGVIEKPSIFDPAADFSVRDGRLICPLHVASGLPASHPAFAELARLAPEWRKRGRPRSAREFAAASPAFDDSFLRAMSSCGALGDLPESAPAPRKPAPPAPRREELRGRVANVVARGGAKPFAAGLMEGGERFVIPGSGPMPAAGDEVILRGEARADGGDRVFVAEGWERDEPMPEIRLSLSGAGERSARRIIAALAPAEGERRLLKATLNGSEFICENDPVLAARLRKLGKSAPRP